MSRAAPASRAPRVLGLRRLGWLAVALALFAPAHAPSRHQPGRAASEREAGHDVAPDWFFAQRAFPLGTIPEAKVQAAFAEARRDRDAAALRTTATNLAWQSAGPYNIGGRVTALVAAPGATTVYLAAAMGGVFKSVNSGVNWTPVFDAYGAPSIGALALDPSDPNVVYAGTGEANASVDSYDGDGVYRSDDAGGSWTHLGLAETRRVAAIVVDPADPNRVFVGAMGTQFSTGPDRGLYRTENGGQTWSQVLFVDDSTGVCDIAINPAHPETVYCATWERVRHYTYRRAYGPTCGIWRSPDHGTTWTRLLTGLPAPSDDVGRIGLAIAPSRPSTIYAQIVSGAALGYVGLGLYRSLDGGTTWSRRDNPSSTTFRNAFGGFGWYFGELAVSPTNPDVVYPGGVSLLRSTDGGFSFSNLTGTAHVDQHAMWIDPANPSRVYLGNDGGFFSSTNGGTSWTKSTDLPISQFYAGAIDPSNPSRLLGGTQDNDCLQTTGSPTAWTSFSFNADGFYVGVDQTAPAITFGEYQYGSYGAGPLRSMGSGAPGTFSTPTGFAAGDRFNWNAPFLIHPLDHKTLLAASQRVYRSRDNGLTYALISPDLTTNNTSSLLVYSTITTLAVSPADTAVYYSGSDDGKVYRSTNSGQSWTDVSAGLPERWVTRVSPDPLDPLVVYVTLSGFGQDERLSHVYRSPDQGDHWTPIASNLPDIPANDLIVDPADTQRLYLATDVGVYTSADRGGYWYPLGQGMPIQAVVDLSLHPGARLLAAATHGRSQWTLDLTELPVGVPRDPAAPGVRLAVTGPNPFRDRVGVVVEIPLPAAVNVAVFDAGGRRVRTLADVALAAGRHPLTWDGRDDRGAEARAGVYYLRAMTSGYAGSVKRLVKLR